MNRTLEELHELQALPLDMKVSLTKDRIREWVREYGVDGTYVSFSGGKDSTVLLYITRQIYPEMKAVFVDTGLEFPSIRNFVKQFNNVDWLKPKMNFVQVIEKYGYPFISKDVSETVYAAKKLFDGKEGPWYENCMKRLNGEGKWKKKNVNQEESGAIPPPIQNEKDYSSFSCERYKFFLEDGAPPISSQCCAAMKKSPVHTYNKKSGRWAITAQMASESRLRSQQWLKNGCNGFDMKSPISNPMSFWFEQDVLAFMYNYWDDLCKWIISENESVIGRELTEEEKSKVRPLAEPYGDIVTEKNKNYKTDKIDKINSDVFDLGRPTYCTTGMSRTGCVFCGYGLHREKSPNRFEKLYQNEPQLYDYVMRGGYFNENGVWKPYKGLGYWYCIEWINEHGGFKITYPNREYYLKKYMTDECKEFIYKKNKK